MGEEYIHGVPESELNTDFVQNYREKHRSISDEEIDQYMQNQVKEDQVYSILRQSDGSIEVLVRNPDNEYDKGITYLLSRDSNGDFSSRFTSGYHYPKRK